MSSARPTPSAASTRPETPPAERVGLWIVGARGAIASCLSVGHLGLERGALEPLGMITEREPFRELGFAPFGSFVLGGCDVRRTPLRVGVEELVREHVLPARLVGELAPQLEALDARLTAGFLDGPDLERAPAGAKDMDPEVARRSSLAPAERVAAVCEDLARFRRDHDLARVIVVDLASTESHRTDAAGWGTEAGFEAALESGVDLPASCLYARAAFESGAGFVNFTPSPGASVPALRAFARARNLPHCGNDGKTGETLVKTALAPMFDHRALRVLSWSGYNMLGNRDGAVLEDPDHKRAKVENKDQVLRELLGSELQSHVGIDFVPSLGDWKTAWDHIHFEGFLGARMTLQFTWTGSDSALATPLVFDLARFTERELRLGRGGDQPHLAPFFKSPIEVSTHDFHLQFQALLAWAEAERDRT